MHSWPNMRNEEAVERVSKNMPPLGLELSLRSKRSLGRLLGVHGWSTPRARQVADGFVRLVEKAVLEYEASRERFIEFLGEGAADDLFRAQDHFESCIQSLHRAIAYLDRLRKLDIRQTDGQAFVPRPRDLEVLRDEAKGKVRRFRDFAEHLDQDVIKGTLSEDAEVSIHLGWEVATLNGAHIEYASLGRWIRQVYGLALHLSVVHLVIGQASSEPGLGHEDCYWPS